MPIFALYNLFQETEIVKLLKNWGVWDSLIGSFDTVADNTGRKSGACILLEREAGLALLYLACRHHVYEVHVKRVATVVLGKTTSPQEPLFKLMEDNWNDLTKDKDHSGIDYSNLKLFDWLSVEGSKLEDHAKTVLEFVESCLEKNVFPRSDYKELAQLIALWLGAEVENYKFVIPKACHRARFMAQSIYCLKYSLLSEQIDFLDPQELLKVSRMAKFVGLFHGYWFLRCPVAAESHLLDL